MERVPENIGTIDNENGWLRLRATGIDRVVAAILAVLLSPIVLVLALLVKREDGGPAFVRVERMGKGFQPFRMWKLRSMRADRPDGRAEGAPLTAVDDVRITQIGARLRHYHLDELPQLLNVVRGEMLLLGPRPEALEFVSLQCPEWQAVLSVPPGIAGPTQMIVGDWERRHIADDPEGDAYPRVVVPAKLALDRWYVETTTPWFDVLTVVALAKRFMPRSHATRMKRRAQRALPRIVGPILEEELQGTRRSRLVGLRRSA
jgi:lipopolysaccharide/colanic/teichoic acid biosynthesis glycosyltransferase